METPQIPQRRTGRLERLVGGIRDALTRQGECRRQAALRREFKYLSDHILKDIGLFRAWPI